MRFLHLQNIFKRFFRYVFYGIPKRIVVKADICSLSLNDLLKDRIALITGGTSGIGYAIARAFLTSGCGVIITGRDREKVNFICSQLKRDFPSNRVILGIDLDGTKIDLFLDKFDEIVQMLAGKQIDILVNNAGIGGGEIGAVEEGEYDTILNTNLKAPFFLSKLVGEYMIRHHIAGNILNICSSSSLRPAASAYTLSKWGLRGFTLGLAKMFAPYHITVNGLAPGPTATPMLQRENDSLEFNENPMGRYATAEEIANLAVILTSGMGKMIVGDIIYVTGGAGIITFDDIPYVFQHK